MAEISGFSQFIEFMAGADAFTLLLPFLLSWMVYYIALEKAEFLWDGNDSLQNMPPILALFMAFFTARFIVLNPYYQSFFMDFFGKITIGIIGIIGLFTMLAFVGYDDKLIKKGPFALAVMAAVGAAFIYAGGFGPPLIQNIGFLSVVEEFFVWTLETGAIWAAVIAVTIWAVLKEPGGRGGNGSGLSLSDFFSMTVDDEARNSPDEG
ncbi:MAG: hypothetical protein V5A72_00370 [Candidatus Nanohaloarchaea archaeon]